MVHDSDSGDSLVAKRLRFLERHRAKMTEHAENSTAAPEGSGDSNRHGMPKLPIGQHVTKKWPVLDLGVHPEIVKEDWSLEICGLVENPVVLNWEQLLALPQDEQTSDFHCVTTWSAMDQNWIGVRFTDLVELVRPSEEAKYLLCTGADHDPSSGEQYTTNLPLLDALQEDVLIVHTWNDQPLPREHGGPVRMITPRLYAWKGTKWITRIEFLAEDHPGFWERRGYSNTANPWFEERYS
ncbi:MAG: sulfite oxidase-like oxidoreductase [Planctomycetota bacterium]|nr:sulfite oxidase-like oxidoreductase [Planctomycetota bacterium]MDA1113838.1 sulfite oxidase-like oxidoreductase [Planctomycetota bacterium]